jgi:hypothetical protein
MKNEKIIQILNKIKKFKNLKIKHILNKIN